MANSRPGQNATVEEILASIRQAISEDDAKRTIVPRPEPRSLAERGPVANVSPVFDEPEQFDPTTQEEEPAVDPTVETAEAPPPDASDQGVIELAIEQAIDGVRAEFDDRKSLAARLRPPRRELVRSPQRPIPRAPRIASPRREAHAAGALLSARVDADVSASFDELAKAMIEGNASKVDAAVEDILRPMLKTWLESNLPQMVERLVREEIERVARGRR
jgi:cell pole-organizing protein PopZ